MSEAPPFQKIAAHYRDRILSSDLKPGDEMPSRRTLVAEHAAARATVDKAMELLALEGLIQLNRSRPATVADVTYRHTTLSDRRASSRATGNALGRNETSTILSVGMVLCPVEIARRLGVKPGSPVLRRKRLNTLEDRPASMSVSYYTPEVAELTPELAIAESIRYGSRELACDRIGSPQARAKNEVVGRLPTPEEGEKLALPSKAMVLEVVRTVFTEDDRVVEVATKVASADRPVTFEVRLD